MPKPISILESAAAKKLPDKALDALQKHGINTLEDLRKMTAEEIHGWPGVGWRTVYHLIDFAREIEVEVLKREIEDLKGQIQVLKRASAGGPTA